MKYLHNSVKCQRNIVQIVSIIVVIALVAGLLVWQGFERWYQANLNPVSSQSNEVFFVIESGMSTIDIANGLEDKGIIKDATAFIWYIDRQGSEVVLQAGSYRLDTSYSVPEIASILINGEVDKSLFTIPPGLRLDQIRDIFVEYGFSSDVVEEAFNYDYNVSVLKYKPASASLEGYIYPETWQVNAESTPQSVIERSLEIFDKLLTDDILNGIKKQKLLTHQAIILASIVQEEVSDPEEQKVVAQVYLKRLSEGMPLQADPTFWYAANVFGGPESSKNESDYNTYNHEGLPPGPIANFTINALEAVANPADTDYLYFISGDDGVARYAKDYDGHLANIEKYCQELCQ